MIIPSDIVFDDTIIVLAFDPGSQRQDTPTGPTARVADQEAALIIAYTLTSSLLLDSSSTSSSSGVDG
jgi:hypothetical protein